MTDSYCSMIHGGLELNLKEKYATAQHCCLHNSRFPIDITTNFWNDPGFIPLRQLNNQNVWAPECESCKSIETVGGQSFRTGMNAGLKDIKTNLSGPTRIDLKFDLSCNLACRSCGPQSSTFWQKHLNEHGSWNQPISSLQQHHNVILALEQLDLSNLQMLVFAGGETMLGQAYWKIAEWLSNNVPNVKQQLTLCFQTNGTQPIHVRNHEIIDRFHLVKLNVSLDGIGERFEYLRWPASWHQVVDNMMQIRHTAPSNVMFHIEETVSIFNLFYLEQSKIWADDNFSSNREGDPTSQGNHLALGKFSLDNCTQEYVDDMQTSNYKNLISKNWEENPIGIESMIKEIVKFDNFRNQSFQKTFPEVAEFYARYL